MKKKIVSIIFTMIIGTILLLSFAYGKNFDKEGIYRVSNPKTNATIICKGDGTVIMKTMNAGNEFIDILDDEKTNKPKLIYKRIEGETAVKQKNYNENGELENEYTSPSYRMELYDLNGKYLGFNVKNLSYITSVIGDKVLYYKDVEGESNRHAFIYDIVTKKEEKAKYPNVEVVKDRKVILMSYYPYEEAKKREVVIYDYDFNEIKKIANYDFNYRTYAKGKSFIKVSTTKKENNKDKTYYNVLDDNFDLIFKEDLDEDIYANDDGIGEIKSDTRIVKYDFINNKLIKDEKRKIDSTKINLMKEQKDGILMGMSHGYYKTNDNNETILYDDNLNLIATLNKKYNNMLIYRHNGNNIYIADNGHYDEEKDTYIDNNDVYDGGGNLKLEKCGQIQVYEEEGTFYIDGKFFDFGFNVVKVVDDSIKSDIFDLYRVGGKAFYANRYAKGYKINQKYNIYDRKLNILHEGVENSDFYSMDNAYCITKEGKTTIYDTDGNVKKIFDARVIFTRYDDVKRTVCFNEDTKRYSILDENFGEIVSNYKMLTDLQKDYCTFLNGFRYGLIDYDGNVLVSFSVFDTMKEDTVAEYKYIE